MHFSTPLVLAVFAVTSEAFAFPQLNFLTHNNAVKGGRGGATGQQGGNAAPSAGDVAGPSAGDRAVPSLGSSRGSPRISSGGNKAAPSISEKAVPTAGGNRGLGAFSSGRHGAPSVSQEPDPSISKKAAASVSEEAVPSVSEKAAPTGQQGNNRGGGGFSNLGGFGSASDTPAARGGQNRPTSIPASIPTSIPTIAFGGGRGGRSHASEAPPAPSTSARPSKPSASNTPSGGCPAVWTEISSDLTGMFVSGGQCTDDARSAIRAIFHDCFPDGGCDGSLHITAELSRPENSPMTSTVNKLASLAQQRGVGVADMIAFAACKSTF